MRKSIITDRFIIIKSFSMGVYFIVTKITNKKNKKKAPKLVRGFGVRINSTYQNIHRKEKYINQHEKNVSFGDITKRNSCRGRIRTFTERLALIISHFCKSVSRISPVHLRPRDRRVRLPVSPPHSVCCGSYTAAKFPKERTYINQLIQ